MSKNLPYQLRVVRRQPSKRAPLHLLLPYLRPHHRRAPRLRRAARPKPVLRPIPHIRRGQIRLFRHISTLFLGPPGPSLPPHPLANGPYLGIHRAPQCLDPGLVSEPQPGRLTQVRKVEPRVLPPELVSGSIVRVGCSLGRVVGPEPDSHPILGKSDLSNPLAPVALADPTVELPLVRAEMGWPEKARMLGWSADEFVLV
ncbi:replicase polyprotein 1ab [Striga asiatica]|uniref:Replicase polyprotein 1ab n=1 Tax=Striga asiatica TaxID=4170 RepID=A0A5A7RK18_STRAF|nr:replicase polyprotein 1ab [Striga asiatica]